MCIFLLNLMTFKSINQSISFSPFPLFSHLSSSILHLSPLSLSLPPPLSQKLEVIDCTDQAQELPWVTSIGESLEGH